MYYQSMNCSASGSQIISSREFWLWLSVILAMALILRLVFWVGPGQRDDEQYLRTAHMILASQYNPLHGTVFSVRTAVCFPIAWFWKLFGTGCATASLYFLLCGQMIVFLGGWLGRSLFGPAEGIISACVLAFLPLDIVFSTQLMPDLPLAAWIAASVCLAVAASDRASLAL